MTGSYALIPLRLFLGLTFTFAALQKLANPAYLSGTSPLSVQATIHSLQHQSPIGFLLAASAHAPRLVGVLIALGELAVGLATLLGLWVRLAAIGGFLLASTFFSPSAGGQGPISTAPTSCSWRHGRCHYCVAHGTGRRSMPGSADARRATLIRSGARSCASGADTDPDKVVTQGAEVAAHSSRGRGHRGSVRRSSRSGGPVQRRQRLPCLAGARAEWGLPRVQCRVHARGLHRRLRPERRLRVSLSRRPIQLGDRRSDRWPTACAPGEDPHHGGERQRAPRLIEPALRTLVGRRRLPRRQPS